MLGVLAAASASAQTVANIPDAEKVDAAIDRGLAYLEETQSPDGSFGGTYGKTTAVVSLAGLAFLAKGYSPRQGPHREAIQRCIDYVLSQQDKDGYFGTVANGMMYAHNITTLFLSEVSGMVDADLQKKVGLSVSRAASLILKAQSVPKAEAYQGGWRYAPHSTDSDMSCSGWAVLALRAARLNGAPVPDKAIKDAIAYVMRNCHMETGSFGYSGPSPSVTLNGAGLLCLELTGHHGEAITLKTGDYILKTRDQVPGGSQPTYANYYNAQATFQLGGKYWETYSKWMYECWLGRQKPDGSWSWGGEEAYHTAMSLLALTVPYRQLPIYQRDETVDEDK